MVGTTPVFAASLGKGQGVHPFLVVWRVRQGGMRTGSEHVLGRSLSDVVLPLCARFLLRQLGIIRTATFRVGLRIKSCHVKSSGQFLARGVSSVSTITPYSQLTELVFIS